jgi:alpha-amylase
VRRIWLNIAILLGCCLTVGQTAAAGVIYQAFNERFAAIEAKLGKLDSLGYRYVQVSPPQKSINQTIWWARYQPLDLRVIEGPLGDEGDLRDLIQAAHARGIKILVDVVLNHMADQQLGGITNLQYAQFSAADFHYPEGHNCISDYRDRNQVRYMWLCDPGNGHELPDLKTSSSYVRGQHKQFLRMLLDMGVDGFRFDAAKHIEASYFADIVSVIPSDKFYYGEVIGETLSESYEYTPHFPVTDFHLLRTLLSAFSVGGDLRYLTHPEAFGAALPGNLAVPFARNHDTVMHAGFFNFGDLRDAMLANAYVIGRGAGTPMVYRDDYDDSIVKAAVRFHNRLEGRGAYVRDVGAVCDAGACNAKTTLVLEREDVGVMIINSANQWLDVPRARMPALAEGCYEELTTGFKIRVAKGGDGQKWISEWGSPQRGGMNVGPRTALFFAKTGC